jgi:hypothetical protein
MRKGIILALGGWALLAGCGQQGDKAPAAPAAPKWKAPYHIEFDSKAATPNPAGVALPAINYTPNSTGQERRAVLVVRFDSSGVTLAQGARDQMIMGPVNLSDSGGALPGSYMDSADQGLGKMLAAACMKGKVKVTVALVRSSVKPDAGESEINTKRLSDWLPTEVVFKNPHPKC